MRPRRAPRRRAGRRRRRPNRRRRAPARSPRRRPPGRPAAPRAACAATPPTPGAPRRRRPHLRRRRRPTDGGLEFAPPAPGGAVVVVLLGPEVGHRRRASRSRSACALRCPVAMRTAPPIRPTRSVTSPTWAAAAAASSPSQPGAVVAGPARSPASTASTWAAPADGPDEFVDGFRFAGGQVERDLVRQSGGHRSAGPPGAVEQRVPSKVSQESATAATASPSHRSSPASARPAVRWLSRKTSTAARSGGPTSPGSATGRRSPRPSRRTPEANWRVHRPRAAGISMDMAAVSPRPHSPEGVVHRPDGGTPRHTIGCPQCPQTLSTGRGQPSPSVRCAGADIDPTVDQAVDRLGSGAPPCPSSSSAGPWQL